jgi:hypothetical protein
LASAVLEGVGPARAQLGAAARAHVLSHFQREPALDRYEAYFRRLIGETP